MTRGPRKLRQIWIPCLAILIGCDGGRGSGGPGVDTQDPAVDLEAPEIAGLDTPMDTEAPLDTSPPDLPPEIGDETPPAVAFVQPQDGAEVEGLVEIEIDATDDTGVLSVELFVDQESLGTDDTAPYEFEWDATELWSGTYALKAVAADAAGNEGEASITATVLGECDEDGDCPPTVFFAAPKAGAFLRGVAEIKAAVEDDDAVVMVRFLVDEGLLVEDTQVPYKAEWGTAEFADGPHALALIAYDTTDKTADAQIEVIVDNTPPELELLTPEEDAILHDEALLSAEATDALQMDRVEFAVDDGEPVAVTEEPWELEYDGAELIAGTHTVTATAIDAAGNEAMVEREFLVDRPPAVTIVAPAPGAAVDGAITVLADAADDIGLEDVVLYMDDAWMASMDLDGEGLYEDLWLPPYEKTERVLSVVATDGAGQEGVATLTVQVDHPVAVELQLCEEATCEDLDSDTELTGTVLLRAVAQDDGADIAAVDFLVDGEPTHQDLEAPFEFPWATTSVGDGARTLQAIATNTLDETGNTQVTVLVNNCDLDHDGFVAAGCGGTDCDDGSEAFKPDAPDLVGDDTDQNCDGMDGVDADGDGYASEASGGDDCLDDDPAAHPCGDDLPGDGVDGNCDGADEASCDDCVACTVDGVVDDACVHVSVEDGGPCDDGDLCTDGDTCQDLVCLPGNPPDCDDQELCTSDGCLPETGCYHLPLDGLPCGDGGVCFDAACCAPDCDGKECGDDGCGGSCGQCQGETTVCEQGTCFDPEACACAPWQTCAWADGCVDPESLGESPYQGDVIVADQCFGTTWIGCCAGEALYYCDDVSGECPGGAELCLVKVDCGAVDGVCGWRPDGEYFGCVQPPALPDPQGDLSCGWYECVPDCDGKPCGPDGCGGDCGDCAEGEACHAGACHPAEGCTIGTTPGCGGCLCEACVCDLDSYCCETAWDVYCVQACVEDCGGCGPCVPDCAEKDCGDDGCNGSCGACPEDEECTTDGLCLPLELWCGDDTCEAEKGENCATCPPDCGPCSTLSCCETHADPGCGDPEVSACVCAFDSFCCEVSWDGVCVNEAKDDCGAACGCEPDCSGGACTDGCGGICVGPCNDGEICTFDDSCIDGICIGAPVDCDDGNPCTEDACQEDLGCIHFPLDEGTCWTNGVCVEGACVCFADCEGRECGDDGCNGSCGQCPPQKLCDEDGQCVYGQGFCGDVTYEGQCQGNTRVWCVNGQVQSEDCDTYGDKYQCQWLEDLEIYGCAPCVPNCEGKLCGNDGCGGSCGGCDEGLACHDGQCAVIWCFLDGDCLPYEDGDLCNGTLKCVAWECAVDPLTVVTCQLPPDLSPLCNTTACDPWTGTCPVTPTNEGGVCDDYDLCTIDDLCVEGACAGSPVICSDGNPCTEDTCDPDTAVCVFQPLDDQSPCGDQGICVEGQCVCVPDCEGMECGDDGCGGSCGECWEGQVCKDNLCCTPDCMFKICGDDGCGGSCGLCGEGQVCVDHDCCTPQCDGKECGEDGCGGSCGDCEDWDGCTEDVCQPDSTCTNEWLGPDCIDHFCICEIHGLKGDTVSCPLMLLRENSLTPIVVGADFALSWDPAFVSLSGFEDEICLGDLCLPIEVPSCNPDGTDCAWGALSPTGHTIVALPPDLADWVDQGTLLFYHGSNPFEALSGAHLEQDGTVGGGDPQYLLAYVELLEDISQAQSVCLRMQEPHFSIANGLTLEAKVMPTPEGLAVVVY